VGHIRLVSTCLFVLVTVIATPKLWGFARVEAQKPEGVPAQRVFGVAPAQVTSVDDPEGLGRIKVKFPWLRQHDEADVWARVSLPVGGKTTGFWALPEIDDEVLVAFEFGELNRPVVIGSLWNGSDRPPDTTSNSLTSPDGRFSIRVTNSGIVLTGPSAVVRVNESDVRVDANNTQIRSQSRTAIDSGLTTDVRAGAGLNLNGALIGLNGSNCAPAARVGDRTAPDGAGGTIITGSLTVTIC
jgi:hypothetical protein